MTQDKTNIVTKNNVTVIAKQNVKKRVKFVPPDGGWGWAVVFGAAICNIFNQSMLSTFSLLYGKKIEEMGHQTQGAAVVLSTMLFMANFGGPLAAILMKLTSPRFTSVIGVALSFTGLFTSAFATNLTHLALSYGILLGCGLGFIQNSTFVAINGYFKLKKSRAVGWANVGTGVGQTLMPHVIRYLLSHYDYRGALLILSGLSLHGIAGTLLIQPAAWHLKKVEEAYTEDESRHLLEEKHRDTIIKRNSINGNIQNGGRRMSEPTTNGHLKHLENGDAKAANGHSNGYSNGHTVQEKDLPKINQSRSILRKIIDFLDLSLLTSPRFLNIIIGTAITVTSLQNFSLIYPLYLDKVAHMEMNQVATCMSIVAMADIIGRIILPIFQDKFKIKARWMLIYTCIWIVIIRQIMAFQTETTILIVLSVCFGFGRSMIIVARNIAIAENCKPEQVPAAVGLGMLTMGIIVPPVGVFLGWLRDYTKSYLICITAQNILMMIMLMTWIPDMLYLWIKEKKEKRRKCEEICMT